MNIKSENAIRYNKSDMMDVHSGLSSSLESYMERKLRKIKERNKGEF